MNLDITHEKETGLALMLKINNMVKEYSKQGNQTLPDVLLMTQTQFNRLNTIDGSMPEMFESTERMYRTPYNLMEVKVKS